MAGKKQIYFFAVKVNGVRVLEFSIIDDIVNAMKMSKKTKEEYARRCHPKDTVSVDTIYISNYRKITELVYSNGVVQDSLKVSKAGFVQSILKITERGHNQIIGIH